MPDERALHELPLIEIDVLGSWRPGRLRAWEPRSDGLWAEVVYETASGQHDRTLPAEQVRPLTSEAV